MLHDADQNEAWELGHRQLCVAAAAHPDVPTPLPREHDAAVVVETVAVDTQPATVTALRAETTAVLDLVSTLALALAPVPATTADANEAQPTVTATATATTTATATVKPAHLCVSSCCGQAATQRCAVCGLVWYCSKEHQTGHWKQHKKVCKATDAVSVRSREIARFLAEEPVEDWPTGLTKIFNAAIVDGAAVKSMVASPAGWCAPAGYAVCPNNKCPRRREATQCRLYVRATRRVVSWARSQ